MCRNTLNFPFVLCLKELVILKLHFLKYSFSLILKFLQVSSSNFITDCSKVDGHLAGKELMFLLAYIIQLLSLSEGDMTICSPKAGNIARGQYNLSRVNKSSCHPHSKETIVL